MCRFCGGINSDTRVTLKLNKILLVLSLNSIHYASFGITVCGFRGRIYSSARVNLKLHDPCEVLARIWKAQNSPRLLLWIYSVLRLKYEQQSKFTVFKIDYEAAKKLQEKNFILWRSKETPTLKVLFAKEQRNSDTQKMDLTQRNRTNISQTILCKSVGKNFDYYFKT